MRVALVTLGLVAASSSPAVVAGKLGEHPTVVTQRLHAAQGYDYASKFYPHPAWLHLLADAPRSLGRHPAVIVHEREQRHARDRDAQTAPPVPAREQLHFEE